MRSEKFASVWAPTHFLWIRGFLVSCATTMRGSMKSEMGRTLLASHWLLKTGYPRSRLGLQVDTSTHFQFVKAWQKKPVRDYRPRLLLDLYANTEFIVLGRKNGFMKLSIRSREISILPSCGISAFSVPYFPWKR